MKEQWKIGEFSKKIGKHANTVDQWFKKLEELKIHFVNRLHATNEKIYDDMDLKIALHIKSQRQEWVPLNEIFDNLENHVELRYFKVNDIVDEIDEPVLDHERLEMKLLYLIEDVLNNELGKLFADLQNQLSDTVNIIQQLAKSNDKQNVRVREVHAIEEIIAELKKDALHMWSSKPIKQRFKRVGIFRKEENREEQEQFIEEYVNRYISLIECQLEGD